MNNYEKIYWLTRLDNINGLFIAITLVSIALIFWIILNNSFSKDMDSCYGYDENKEREKTRKKLSSKIKYIISTLIISVLMNVFLPSQKEAVLIIAGGKTIDFIESDSSITKIPAQTTLLISNFFDNKIKELEKENKDK